MDELLIWSIIEIHTTIVAACTATFKLFAKHFFPGLLGIGSSSGGGHPTTQGQGTKFKGSPYNGQSFPLHRYGETDLGQHVVTVTTKAERDPRRCDGDAEIQESIIRVMKHDMDAKDGVTVTLTVQIS